uniref:Uncharacterized protein n=1 Tax=Panagrolaimus superbus TaxID=310955 RepID=A0A914Y5U8_9BILA
MTEIEIIFKRSFKGVILEVFNAPLFAPYRSNHEFCQALKTKFVKLQIPTYFLTNEEWLFARIFAYKNYSSSINDIISAILVDGDMGSVAYYKYTQNGYEMLSPNMIKITSSTEMNQREALQRNPKTVFLLPTRCPTGIHLEWLKSSLSKVTNLVDLTTGFSFSEDVFIQALHGIIDKDSFQCKFVPLCFKEAYVRTLNDPCPIITTNVLTRLPLQIAKIVDKIVDKIVVGFWHIIF